MIFPPNLGWSSFCFFSGVLVVQSIQSRLVGFLRCNFGGGQLWVCLVWLKLFYGFCCVLCGQVHFWWGIQTHLNASRRCIFALFWWSIWHFRWTSALTWTVPYRPRTPVCSELLFLLCHKVGGWNVSRKRDEGISPNPFEQLPFEFLEKIIVI